MLITVLLYSSGDRVRVTVAFSVWSLVIMHTYLYYFLL